MGDGIKVSMKTTEHRTSAMAKAHIYSFQKNQIEEVRIHLDNYKGTDVCDIRVWWDNRPTRKGLTIAVDQLDELAKGIERASSSTKKDTIHIPPLEELDLPSMDFELPDIDIDLSDLE